MSGAVGHVPRLDFKRYLSLQNGNCLCIRIISEPGGLCVFDPLPDEEVVRRADAMPNVLEEVQFMSLVLTYPCIGNILRERARRVSLRGRRENNVQLSCCTVCGEHRPRNPEHAHAVHRGNGEDFLRK